MRQIKVEKLTRESFAPFGAFYDFANPDGYAFEGEIYRFYPDRMRDSYQGRVAFSAIQVIKPDRMVIHAIEYHTHTSEIILPMNDDIILHVAPASGKVPVTHLTRAFWVPQNTMVQINAGTWHLCPLPVHADTLQAIIVLPECTYANDCVVVPLNDEQVFEIVPE